MVLSFTSTVYYTKSFLDFIYFCNNVTILLNIWMYLYCAKHCSISSAAPLPEATILEPHVYKNTLGSSHNMMKESAILKVIHITKMGNKNRQRLVGFLASSLLIGPTPILSTGNILGIERFQVLF